jgi:hypothetical protein
VDDRLSSELRSLDAALAGSPPEALVRAGRAEAGNVRARHRSRLRSRIALALSAALALVAASFTPPGRAATEWVNDLAGVGDPPTLDHPFDKPGSIVIHAGTLPDGAPYELVARLIDPDDRFQDRPGGAPHPATAGGRLCFGVDLPTHPEKDQDSVCVANTGETGDDPPFSSYGAFSASDGSGPVLLFGLVEDPRVAQIEVVEGRDGVEAAIPSNLIPVDSAILERVGRVDPVRIFLSPVSEALVRAAERGELDLYAVGLTDDGAEIGRAGVLGVDRPVSPALKELRLRALRERGAIRRVLRERQSAPKR